METPSEHTVIWDSKSMGSKYADFVYSLKGENRSDSLPLMKLQMDFIPRGQETAPAVTAPDNLYLRLHGEDRPDGFL